jgi:uncharacterized protein YdiU (UPF0061 family)
MTIKESLLNGTTPEKLIADLKKEIAAAQEEIDKSKKEKQITREKEIADAREGLVISALFYLEKLGLIDEGELDDEYGVEQICNYLKESEADMTRTANVIRTLKGSVKNDTDTQFEEFLKNFRI